MGRAIRATYNFSSTFCYFVPHYAAEMLKKDYNKDTIDLKELDLHNGIEHDASLVRECTLHLVSYTLYLVLIFFAFATEYTNRRR